MLILLIGKHDTICHNVSKLITCESCYFSNSGNVELDTPHYFTLAIMHVQCHLLAWAGVPIHWTGLLDWTTGLD